MRQEAAVQAQEFRTTFARMTRIVNAMAIHISPPSPSDTGSATGHSYVGSDDPYTDESASGNSTTSQQSKMSVDCNEVCTATSAGCGQSLKKLGYSSKVPTEIRHGPIEMGGLNLMNLRTEIGISAIKYMRNAIYSASETGSLLMILNLKYSQIEAGISNNIVENTEVHLPYLTSTWITSI